jgi:acetyl-CoA acetyltransferase
MWQLQRTRGLFARYAMCVGVAQGIAAILERV